MITFSYFNITAYLGKMITSWQSQRSQRATNQEKLNSKLQFIYVEISYQTGNIKNFENNKN
jgi:hypothetical protein